MNREQPRMYDEEDLTWIASIVDHAVDAAGQPWRVLRERLEHAPIASSRTNSILGALRRVTGGRAARTAVARKVRAATLGRPVLDAPSRDARLDEVAATLGMARDELDALLWIDLADERPVTLPDGRPAEHRLAAYANLDHIQRRVRRARTLRLRVWGDALPLIRAAKRYGLLATITVVGEATVLDVIGPLSLFHSTTVYGRALGQLIPLLVEVERFELELACETGHGPTMLYLASPILLPPIPLLRRFVSPAARLARDLSYVTTVQVDPPPIEHGTDRLFPELAIEHEGRQFWVELVGFATTDYLAAKLARYQAAGYPDVVLCVEDARAEPTADEPREVLRYKKRLDATTLLAHLEALPRTP